MKIVTVIALFCAAAVVPSFAQASLYDPSIKHKPKDGVVKLYGAGGPHTAFKKVAEVWEKRSGTKVELSPGLKADGLLMRRQMPIYFGVLRSSR